MTTVTANIYEAKTQLSRLIADAERGADVTITRRGVPVVRLVPVRDPPGRELGFWPAACDIPLDVFAPMSGDELAVWEDGSAVPDVGDAS